MKQMSTAGWIAFVLVVIGGINWGLVGAFNIDLVTLIFGAMSIASRVVYVLVGLGALYMLFDAFSAKQ